jgi:ribosomal protein L32
MILDFARTAFGSIGGVAKHAFPIRPHIICEWLGHDREEFNAGQYIDRGGRWRTRRHRRCKRCGTSDGGTVFAIGKVEHFRLWRILAAIRETKDRLSRWRLTNCGDCGKPEIAFGRKVGRHDSCFPIPF